MASITSNLLLPLFLLFISLSLSSARPGISFHPCNTVIVSTYSFSLLPQNPNPNFRDQFIIFSADLRPYHHHHHHFRHRRFMANPLSISDKSQSIDSPKQLPEFSPLGFSSLRDRTKDILSVVASLLFGAACGALTAGTMYLVWSLFNHRHDAYRSLDGFNSDDDVDNDDDDIFNPKKKGGYVAIPAAPAKVVDSVPPPVKESA
ncbi:Histidine--tRNA ligase [Bienertia sinuspersici]